MFDYTNPMNLPLDVADEQAIDKLLSKIERNWHRRENMEDVQLALDVCCRHAVQHKDASKLTKLRNSMPRHAPVKLVMDWIGCFTTFKWLKNKAGAYVFLGRDEEGAKDYSFDLKGRDVPFWTFEKPKVEKDYVFKDRLASLFKVALKKVEAGKVTEQEAAFIKYMAEAATSYKPASVIIAKEKKVKVKAKAKAKVDAVEVIETPAIALAA